MMVLRSVKILSFVFLIGCSGEPYMDSDDTLDFSVVNVVDRFEMTESRVLIYTEYSKVADLLENGDLIDLYNKLDQDEISTDTSLVSGDEIERYTGGVLVMLVKDDGQRSSYLGDVENGVYTIHQE